MYILYDLVLLNPPSASYAMPYMALPSIISYCKSNGYNSVKQCDLNIELIDHFMSNKGLKEMLNNLENNEFDAVDDTEYIRIICESLTGTLDDFKSKFKNKEAVGNDY